MSEGNGDDDQNKLNTGPSEVTDPALKKPFLPPQTLVSAPVREEFVQNAVNFLKHPSVKGSAVKYRRSFLETKGLTPQEIDEAFRRVPDVSPVGSSAESITMAVSAPTASEAGPLNVSAPQSQHLYHPQGQSHAVVNPAVTSPLSWSKVVLAVTVISAGGTAIGLLAQNYFVPWVKRFSEAWSTTRASEKEANEAAKAAAKAASDLLDVTKKLLEERAEERNQTASLTQAIQEQTSQIKSLLQLHTSTEGFRSQPSNTSNYKPDGNIGSAVQAHGRDGSGHEKSMSEVLEMVQRGEIPPGIRDINDMPPDPTRPLSAASLAPRRKPWEKAPLAATSQAISPAVPIQDPSTQWWQRRNPQAAYAGPDVPVPVQYNEWGAPVYSNAAPLPIGRSPASNGPIISEISDKELAVVGGASPVLNGGGWVPPPAPQAAMAEAVVAIRQQQKVTSIDSNVESSSADVITSAADVNVVQTEGGLEVVSN